MDSEALQAMANDGYAFLFKDNLVLVHHSTIRNLTLDDQDPFLLFELRGRGKEQVAAALRERRAQQVVREGVTLYSPEEAEEVATQILGIEIKGLPVRKVLIDEAADIESEIYLGITNEELEAVSRRLNL